MYICRRVTSIVLQGSWDRPRRLSNSSSPALVRKFASAKTRSRAVSEWTAGGIGTSGAAARGEPTCQTDRGGVPGKQNSCCCARASYPGTQWHESSRHPSRGAMQPENFACIPWRMERWGQSVPAVSPAGLVRCFWSGLSWTTVQSRAVVTCGNRNPVA
jgi:hypothetical protein